MTLQDIRFKYNNILNINRGSYSILIYDKSLNRNKYLAKPVMAVPSNIDLNELETKISDYLINKRDKKINDILK